MRISIIVEPAAESDLQAAFEWYENQVEGLGHEFLVSVRACFAGLERNPKMYREVFLNLRRASIDRFPFGIFYIVTDESAYVIGAFHHKQNPKSWMKRIKIWGSR